MIPHSEIYRYMGHRGTADGQLEALVSSCLEKLSTASAPRHLVMPMPCTVSGDSVTIGELTTDSSAISTVTIKSSRLAEHLSGCIQVYILAATLGAAVDRLISQRGKIDSAETLCLQACAAAQIEDYCNNAAEELSREVNGQGLYLRPRFSPGYGDFDIAFQTDILRILQAQKRIGVTETKSHMLTPLKSVTALIGVCQGGCPQKAIHESGKCADCAKTDCQFRVNQPL